MPNLRNISLKKFLTLNSEEFENYHSVLKWLKPVNEIKGNQAKELGELTFGQVCYMRKGIGKPEMISKIFNMVFGMTEQETDSMKVVDFYGGFNHIIAELKKLSEAEKQLTSKPDPDWKLAGAERLNRFGELNTLIALGERFGVEPRVIEGWPYGYVFALSLQQSIGAEVQKEYAMIKSRPK